MRTTEKHDRASLNAADRVLNGSTPTMLSRLCRGLALALRVCAIPLLLPANLLELLAERIENV
jgi:hypothetical protein